MEHIEIISYEIRLGMHSRSVKFFDNCVLFRFLSLYSSIYNFIDSSSVFNIDANVRNSQKKYRRKNRDSPYIFLALLQLKYLCKTRQKSYGNDCSNYMCRSMMRQDRKSSADVYYC